MKAIVLFLFVLVSCSHSIYVKDMQGNNIRHCTTPDLFIVSSKLPPEDQLAVYKGFIYWNDILDKDVFIYAGPQDIGNAALINIKGGYVGGDRCVKNNMRFLESGCMIGSEVTIKEECLSHEPEMIETLARQAAANILGLANEVKPGSLMDFRIQPEAQHPIDASEDEIKAIMLLYK